MFQTLKKLFGSKEVSPLLNVLPHISAAEFAKALSTDPLSLHKGIIHYLLVWAKYDSLEELSPRATTITNHITACQGSIMSINCCFVVATFGMATRNDPRSRLMLESAVKLLAEKESSSLKIVYGSTPGLFGCLGSNAVLQFGPILPDYSRKVQRLLELEWGKQMEY